MTKSETKLLFGIGVLILLIDILLMKYWVSNIKPDPFGSVGVETYRLGIFGVNILIGITFFLIRKRLSFLFFVNTIVCYLVFSFFWNSWLENHPYSVSEFIFKTENRNFKLNVERNPDLSELTKFYPSLKIQYYLLECMQKKEIAWNYLLWKEQCTFLKIIGFPDNPGEIELNKSP